MIIVTGGAGFIGSNLVAGLEGRGYTDIVICDRLGAGEKWRNLMKREVYEIVPPENLFRYLDSHAREIEAIFHLASSEEGDANADHITRTNFTLALDLWSWCAFNDMRMIYASSATTYGDGVFGFEDDDSVEALARLQPLSAYAWSKHQFDRRAARAAFRRGWGPRQWVGLKLFDVYGPNEYHKGEGASFFARQHEAALAGEGVRLFRSTCSDYMDGEQRRDFTWIGDCVDVMLWFLETPDVSGIFNVGTGRARSFRDAAHVLCHAAGVPEKIDFIDMPKELRARYQHYTQADIRKLRKAGYAAPFTDLEAGVRKYVKDYLSQPDPYL